MPMEMQCTCLGNALRKGKKEEVKLKFQRHRDEMLKQKKQRMEGP
jgi:hypothetical protein